MTKCCGQESYENGRPQHDRRLQLIDGIKQLIGDIDNEERSRGRGSGQKRGGGVNIPGVRDMEEECLQYRKRRECSPPTITSIATHETRPTSMYDTMKYESSKRLTYVDATRTNDPYDPMPPAPWELPRTPSQELRAGTLYMSCDCRKRNGLQHDCQRYECGGRPTCLAINPGPCCEPSKARKPVRGDRRHRGVQAAQVLRDPPDTQMVQTNVPPTSAAKGPTGGPKDSSTMVCLCAPVGACKTPGPVASAATPKPVQTSGQVEFVGVIAGYSPAPNQRAGPAPNQMCGQGQCHRAVGGMTTAPAQPQPQPSGQEFIAISQSGGKFLCCPMPS